MENSKSQFVPAEEIAAIKQKEREDKSNVTLRVPKRFWKGNSAEYVEWREFKLKTRLMPNGYRVTLGLVVMECIPGIPGITYRTVLGASACSPSDIGNFSYASAYQRALGRARQKAFDSIYEPVTRETLLYDPNVGGDISVEDFRTLSSIKDVLDAIHEGTDAATNSHYDLVARNAERIAVLHETSALRWQFGYRFDIIVGN